MALRTVFMRNFLFATTVDVNFAASELKHVSHEKTILNHRLLPHYAWGIS